MVPSLLSMVNAGELGEQMNNKFGHWEMEYLYNYIWLMVLTILKNMKVNGKDDITYMKWKIKNA